MKPSSKELSEMYAGGLTTRQIAERLSEDHWEVWSWLKEIGVKMRRGGRPRKLPSASVLRRLYVTEKKSSTEIAALYGCGDHKPVIAALDRAGIPVRKSGPQKLEACAKCPRPIKRVYHKGFHCWYGTLCARHRAIHRASLGRYQSRKVKAIPWQKWRMQSEVPDDIKQSPEYQLFLDEEREKQCLTEARESLRQTNQFLKQRGHCLWPSAGL